jgi:hypothetical protein
MIIELFMVRPSSNFTTGTPRAHRPGGVAFTVLRPQAAAQPHAVVAGELALADAA